MPVTVDWLLDDEFDPRAAVALDWIRLDRATEPQLWHFEVRNVLLVAERRERLGSLGELPILTDQEPDLQSAFDLSRTAQGVPHHQRRSHHPNAVADGCRAFRAEIPPGKSRGQSHRNGSLRGRLVVRPPREPEPSPQGDAGSGIDTRLRKPEVFDREGICRLGAFSLLIQERRISLLPNPTGF